MKKSVRYILGGILAVLGFSSCSALREARQDRIEQLSPRQQQTIEEIKAELDAKYEAGQRDDAVRQQQIRDSIRRAQQRNVLLYAVPNVPYQVREK